MEKPYLAREICVGIVGLGKMGLLHTSLLNILPNVRIAALCDKSWLMRKIARNTMKKALVTDKLDELQSLGLDAVVITTPISSHYNIVKEILLENITHNLLVEKTLSSSYAKSKELFEMSKTRNGVSMVGYMKRFSVTFKKAKNLLDQNALGQLDSFKAYAYSSDFVDVKIGSSKSDARGGVLEDLGSHIVDLALWFFGDLGVNSAIIQSVVTKDSVDSANFSVAGSEGIEGDFDVSWVKEGYRMPEFGFTMTGTKGTITVDDNELKLELSNIAPASWYRQDLDDNVPFLLGDTDYYREDEHFIKSLLSGSIPESNFQTAMKVDLLLEQVRRMSNE